MFAQLTYVRMNRFRFRASRIQFTVKCIDMCLRVAILTGCSL
ncbi:MAG: hypothetical protein ACRENA_04310 [Vulcanimicrobiaceae bacterium]